MSRIYKIKKSSQDYLDSTSKYIEATKTREEIETKYVNEFPEDPVTREAPPEIPAFPINEESVASMTAGNAIHDRMKIIIRKAQCDFQFATIYEQRKTNQLLVAGFRNLAEVIDGMGRRIASSIDDLGLEIENMSSTLNESIRNISTTLDTQHERSLTATETVANKIGGFHEFFQKDSIERSEREKRTLRMLDNIQRGKRPKVELPDIFGNSNEPEAHNDRAEKE